jgi:hypothetical protein
MLGCSPLRKRAWKNTAGRARKLALSQLVGSQARRLQRSCNESAGRDSGADDGGLVGKMAVLAGGTGLVARGG